MKQLVINGTYRHFKGNNYKVLYVAKHSENLEDMVVYQALYGERNIWVRPLDMFLEQVKIDGRVFDRFAYINDNVNATISVELSSDIKEYLFDNEIDFIQEIKTKLPQVAILSEPKSDGTKDLSIVILCSGVAVTLVIMAINRLIETIVRRPKYIEVIELSEDGNVLTSHTELMQPDVIKREFEIGFEISAPSVKLKVSDKSE